MLRQEEWKKLDLEAVVYLLCSLKREAKSRAPGEPVSAGPYPKAETDEHVPWGEGILKHDTSMVGCMIWGVSDIILKASRRKSWWCSGQQEQNIVLVSLMLSIM